MKKLFKVIISGPAASGKTTLLHLLDGHQNLVNYHHDKVLMLFDKFFISNPIYKLKDLIGDKKSIIIKSRSLKKNVFINIETLKKRLYEISYGRLESGAFYKESPSHFSAESFHKSQSHKFVFDFEGFDKNIKNDIFKIKKKTFFFEEIIDIYFSAYFKNWKNKRNNNYKNIIFKSPNERRYITNSLGELKKSKCIYIKRDILGLTKSRASDLQIRDKNYGKKININHYFKRILFSKYIDNIVKTYAEIDNLKLEFKSKLYITSLEKIIYETNHEMKKIISFLNLQNKEDYFFPSYNGYKSNKSHVIKINDDKILISNNLINLYKLRVHGLSYYINYPSKFSFINLITYCYIIIKNFIIYKNV